MNVYNYLQIFDLIILPSRVDPFPLIMLEAAYLKIPFIGSNVDGIKELVENETSGILFDSKSPLELYQSILYLYMNPQKSYQMANNLYQKVKNNYSAEKIVHQYQILYSSLK